MTDHVDPDTNLARQRELAAEIHATIDGTGAKRWRTMPIQDLAAELAEHVQALDQWISRGGCVPDAWVESARAAHRAERAARRSHTTAQERGGES